MSFGYEIMIKLTLMFRPYCGLCHIMLEQLQHLQKEINFDIEIIEIDDFPEVEARYNELVPVLLHHENQICYWHLDEPKLISYLTNLQSE